MKRRALALSSFCVVFAAAWIVLATGGANAALELHPPPPLFDFFDYYRPNAIEAFGRIAHGDLPLWTPLHGLGSPLLATLQTGVLYPPNLVHLGLPAQTAFAVLAALHVALAAGVAGALSIALGASTLGAIVAGASFGASMQIAGAVWTPPTLYAAAWAPAVLLGVDRVTRAPAAGSIAGLAFAIALQALTGWPYFCLMTGVAGALYGSGTLVLRWCAAASSATNRAQGLDARGLLVRFAALALAVLLGVALAAPLLLPAGELAIASARAFGSLDAKKAVLAAGAHHPLHFVRSLLEHGANDGVPGIVSLGLALLGVVLRGRGRARTALLIGAGTVGLLIGFAEWTPLYRVLRGLPLIGDFRFPFRWHLLPTLAIAVGAGVGLTRLEQASARSLARGPVFLLALFAIGFQPAILWRQMTPFPRVAATLPPTVRDRIESDLVAGLPREERVFWEDRADRRAGPLGLRALHDLEPLTLIRTAELLTFLELGRAVTVEPLRAEAREGQDPVDAAVAPFYGRLGLPPRADRIALLDLLAVSRIVTRAPSAELLARMTTLDRRADGSFVLANPNALSRIRRVREAELAPPGANATLARLADPAFPHATRVLISDPDPASRTLVERPAGSEPGHAVPAVHVLCDDAETIDVETEDAEAGWIVIADAFFAGWEADVDGLPAPVLRANHALRAVAVPAGRNRLTIRYRPKTFRLGLLAASTALLLLAGLVRAGVRCRSRIALREGEPQP